MTWWQILLLVVGIIAVLLLILALVGRKLQKKSNESQAMLEQNKQTVSMLIIDKKRMKLKDSNLPKVVQEQVPKYLQFRKFPLVKAKVGPKIMTFLCDEKVFKEVPVKKEAKVDIAGMYIVNIKSGKLSIEQQAAEKAAAKQKAKADKKANKAK